MGVALWQDGGKMKFLLIGVFFALTLFGADTKQYQVNEVPKHMSVKEKKERFFSLVAPVVMKVHKELEQRFDDVNKTLSEGKTTPQIKRLKQIYKVKTDQELLMALKPHPASITIAQAAMESAWGTSRFFVEANNIFGVWAKTDKVPRIAASVKRGGKHTIWLRKYDTLEAAVRSYYGMMGRNPVFKEFREVRYKTENPYEIVKKLDKYSEMGEAYTKEIASVIRYNKLQRYDQDMNTSKP